MPPHIRGLLLAVNDESYTVRELAVRVLGRISGEAFSLIYIVITQTKTHNRSQPGL